MTFEAPTVVKQTVATMGANANLQKLCFLATLSTETKFEKGREVRFEHHRCGKHIVVVETRHGDRSELWGQGLSGLAVDVDVPERSALTGSCKCRREGSCEIFTSNVGDNLTCHAHTHT